MKLKREFYKLPLRFDTQRLVEEVSGFSENEWREHPQKFAGNSAMVLISPHGEISDAMYGPMAITEKLRRCPYIQQVLASFNTVFGRSRLMRLAPGAEVNLHNDVHYSWRNRVRIHVPIITKPAVRFHCGRKSVHMAAGEAWIFDNWKPHRVTNPSKIHRIHLVADTVGTAAFWDLVRELHLKGVDGPEPRFIPYKPGQLPTLNLEQYNQTDIMPPAELNLALREMIVDLRADHKHDPFQCGEFVRVLDDLRYDWQSLWVRYGPDESAWPHYRELLTRARARMATFPRTLTLKSTAYPVQDAVEAILAACLNTPQSDVAPVRTVRTPPRRAARRFDRPVFIIAAPRSGSTLLYETLAANTAFVSLGDESHRQIESIPTMSPRHRDYESNRLLAADATPANAKALHDAFWADLLTADGTRLADLPAERRPARVRFLEKTPKNALRIPFLHAVFPDARFIFLHRSPRDNISSLLDSWRSGRYVTYPQLPEWNGPPWSHLLIPGWRALKNAPLPEIILRQWQTTNRIILDDLQAVPARQWCAISYEDLLANPAHEIQRLCEFADVPFGPRMRQVAAAPLRVSRYALSTPDPDKWQKNAADLAAVLPEVEELAARLDALRTPASNFAKSHTPAAPPPAR